MNNDLSAADDVEAHVPIEDGQIGHLHRALERAKRALIAIYAAITAAAIATILAAAPLMSLC